MLPKSMHEKEGYLDWSSWHWDDHIYFTFGQSILDEAEIKFKKPAAVDAAWSLAVQLRWFDGNQLWTLSEVELQKLVVCDQTLARGKNDEHVVRRHSYWTMKTLKTQADRGAIRKLGRRI